MSVYNQGRSLVVKILFISVVCLLLARLFYLQIVNSDYKDAAQNESVLRKINYPQRGVIYDRKGRVILESAPAYDLMFTPSKLKGFDTISFCNIMGIDTATFRATVNSVGFKNGYNKVSAFAQLLDNEIVARFNENAYRFEPYGFFIQDRPIRNFNYNCGFHLFGYVSEVDTAYIRRSNNFYQLGDFAGKTGLEYTYEKMLMGQRGIQYLIKDKNQNIVGPYENGKYDTLPVAGKSLHTGIDIKVQSIAEKMLRNKIGSIVAIDPKDGSVICLASGPSFDPNEIKGASFGVGMRKLRNNPTQPLFNNSISSKASPGSAFKPIGALIALDEGIITPSYGVGCGGRYYACGGKGVGCHGGGHGYSVRAAMAASCNSYFCHIFRKTVDDSVHGSTINGFIKWKNYCNQFGIGRKLGIDLPGESAGYLPDTGRMNREFGFERWNSCNMVSLGIGQDKMESTPLQMANMMCIIANKGSYFIPHVVTKIDDVSNEDTTLNRFKKRIKPVDIPDSTFEEVKLGMEDVVKQGTARNVLTKNISIAGKTGTVENATVLNGQVRKLEDHSVFTCFAPVDDPKIAVCVYIRNAGFGATVAAPMAKLIVRQYINDSLDKKDSLEVESWAKRTIIPGFIRERKYQQDSADAFSLFRQTGDSDLIMRYLPPPPVVKSDTAKTNLPKDKKLPAMPTKPAAVVNDGKNNKKQNKDSTK
jgi:penicillin-binding protein 2